MSTKVRHLADGRTVKQNVYDHGGSRVWIEAKDGTRDLIADTYGDDALSDWIFYQACYYIEKLKS